MAKANKIMIKFKGNFQNFMFGESYVLTEDEAMPYVLLGYAEIINNANNAEEIQ